MNNFSSTSKRCHRYLKTGQLKKARDCYTDLAELLEQENKYTDELKVLMLICYIDLNFTCKVDSTIAKYIAYASKKSKLGKKDRLDLFLDTVEENCVPQRIVSLLECYEIIEYCVTENKEAIQTLLNLIAERNHLV